MIDVDRFRSSLHSDGGLAVEGVQLPEATLAALRGHDAYALAWFENWTRDGQPATGSAPLPTPYPTSPDVDISTFEATGYATTGDDDASAAPPPAAPRADPAPLRRRRRLGASAAAAPPEPAAPGYVAPKSIPPAAGVRPSDGRVPSTGIPASAPLSTGGWAADLERPNAPHPGWYPSPTSSTDVQWWDGSAWTPDKRPVAPRRRGLARFVRR